MYGSISDYKARSPIEEAILREVGLEYGMGMKDYKSTIDDIQQNIAEIERKNHEAAKKHMRDVRPVHCPICKNDDPSEFINKAREGDIICYRCGAVVAANALYEGEYTRNFEGEEDTSQVGAAYDPLMPGAENLKTVFVANSSKALKTIQQRQRNIEDNLSNAFSDNKETRVEYKTKMKLKALADMQRVGNNLDLSDAVVDLAHRYFCLYRDRHEKVNFEYARIAHCLIFALRQKQEQEADVFKVNRTVHHKKFVCQQCGLDFITQRDLRTHVCDNETKELDAKRTATVQDDAKRQKILNMLKRQKAPRDERDILNKKSSRKK